MNLFSNMRVIMFNDSNTPSHLCAHEAKRGNLDFAIVQQEFHVFDRRDVRQIALVVLQHVRDVARDSA